MCRVMYLRLGHSCVNVVDDIVLKCSEISLPLLWSYFDCSFVAGSRCTSLMPTHLSSVNGQSDWSIKSSGSESNSRDT